MFSRAIAGSVVMAGFSDGDPSRCTAGFVVRLEVEDAGQRGGGVLGRGVGEGGIGNREGCGADRGCWDRRAGIG